MHLRTLYGNAILVPAFSLLMILANQGYSQQEAERDDDDFMHRTLAKISGLQPELRSFYRPESLKNELVMARESLRSHLEYGDGVLQQLQLMTHQEEERRAILDKDLESLTLEMKKATGYSFLSEETVELLLRNCLVELQRLEWESIGLTSEAESNDKNHQMEAELIKLQANERGLVDIARRLDAAKAELEELSKLVQQGLAPTSKLRAGEAAVADIEAALEQKRFSLEVAKTEMRALQSSTSEAAAAKMKGIEQKKVHILKQIDALQSQKAWAQKASMIRDKSEVASSRIRDVEMMMLKYATKKTEYSVLVEMIQSALDKEKEPRGNP